MAINEEKMFVLKMLEEGKITSEEAARLLEALDADDNGNETSSENQGKSGDGFYSGEQGRGAGEERSQGSAYGTGQEQGRGQTGSNDKNFGRQYKGYGNEGSYQSYYEKFMDELNSIREKANQFRRDLSSNAKDFDKLVDEFSTKAEKVLSKAAKGTAGFVDKFTDFISSFIDTNSYNIFGSFNTLEKNYTVPVVSAGTTGIILEGTNGTVSVKKHDQPQILIKAKVRTIGTNIDEVLKFKSDESGVTLTFNKTSNLSVSYEAFIPPQLFREIRIATSNGKIYAEDICARDFECITSNASIELLGAAGEKMDIVTKNAKVTLTYTTGKEISVETTNSQVEIKHMKAGVLEVFSTNGRLMLENIQNLETEKMLRIDLGTTNAGIKVYMNDTKGKHYLINAATTNGGINLLIPDLIYRKGPDGNEVEAESTNAGSSQMVNITAETTNGHIEIVR